MRYDNQKNVGNEYFDFQEKINFILEEQDEIFSLHMQAIKVKIIFLMSFSNKINRKMLSY